MLCIIDPTNNPRVGIATVYGKPYYRFSTYLKALNLPFDSLLPNQILDYSGHLIFTTKKEFPPICETPLLDEEIFDQHITVIKGMMIQKLHPDFERDMLIFGVDPGQRTGLSIFYYGKEIESSFYSSSETLVFHIIQVLEGLKTKRKIIKIGNGNMKIANQIALMLRVNSYSPFELEFVDEKNTSLKIKNFNQGGKRDMLSAKYISQRDGFRHLFYPVI